MKKLLSLILCLLTITSTFANPLDAAISELDNSRTRETQYIERKAQIELQRCMDLKCRDDVTIEKYKALSELNEKVYLYLKNLVQN